MRKSVPKVQFRDMRAKGLRPSALVLSHGRAPDLGSLQGWANLRALLSPEGSRRNWVELWHLEADAGMGAEKCVDGAQTEELGLRTYVVRLTLQEKAFLVFQEATQSFSHLTRELC